MMDFHVAGGKNIAKVWQITFNEIPLNTLICQVDSSVISKLVTEKSIQLKLCPFYEEHANCAQFLGTCYAKFYVDRDMHIS